MPRDAAGPRGGKSAIRGAGALAIGMIVAALFGLLFQSLLSYYFGAGAETDAFFMSVSIFALLSKFLMLGQMKSIALPVYGRALSRSPEAGSVTGPALLGGVMKSAVLALAVVALLIAVAAPLLVRVFAPGFDEEASRITTTLLRIRLPALVFTGFVTIARIALETRSEFGLATVVQQVVPAVAAFALLLWLGADAVISDVAWIGLAGAGAGALLLLLLRPGLLRGSMRVALSNADVRSAGRGWLRFSESTGATFLGEWAFRVGASLLPVGVFSAVLYGRMVHDVAHGAINDPATTVTLPQISRAAESGGKEAAGALLRTRVASLVTLTAPVAALLALLAPWIVAILFGRGRFLEGGMLAPTSLALAMYAVGFLVQGVNQILFTGAFAVGASPLVNRVNLIGHLARAVILVPLVLMFGLAGLVGAQVSMNVLVFILVLGRWPVEFGLRSGVAGRALWSRLGRVVAAAALTASVAWPALDRLGDPLAWSLGGRLLVFAGMSVGLLTLYVGLASALRVPVVSEARVALDSLLGSGMDPAAAGEDASGHRRP